MKLETVDRVVVNGKLHEFAGSRNIIDETGFDVWCGNFALIVGAFVVVDVEVIDAGKQMIVESLFEIRTLVLHDGDDRQIMQE